MVREPISLALALLTCLSAATDADIQLGGSIADDVPSLIYDAPTGDLSVEGGGRLMTTIEIKSEGGLVQKCFDERLHACPTIFRLVTVGFDSLTFEGALEPELPPDVLRDDLTARGSFFGGGFFSSEPPSVTPIDLVYVPESIAAFDRLLAVVLIALIRARTVR